MKLKFQKRSALKLAGCNETQTLKANNLNTMKGTMGHYRRIKAC